MPNNTATNHYQLLGVRPTASVQEIRRAYRDLSKLYHPDTTTLAPEVATEQFKQLNDAYATLSSPERRLAYDYSIGISRMTVIQAPNYLNQPASERRRYEKSHAYLDPNDRPLSPGELFALFILGVTFVGCLLLVVVVGWSKGELVLQPPVPAIMPQGEVRSVTADARPVPAESQPPTPKLPEAPRVAQPMTEERSGQALETHHSSLPQTVPVPLHSSTFFRKII